jgi:hypothetical protein
MLYRLIIAFLLFWLPLQGWAAVVMPFCRHATHSTAAAVGTDRAGHDGHAYDHSGSPAHSACDGFDSTCDDCAACHLACAPGMPSAPLVVWMPSNAAQYQLLCATPSLFDPEQSKRPPVA